MLDVLTIPIILNIGQNFFYYLLLMEKVQNRIEKIFRLKIKLKLVNNSNRIKYNIKYNMFSLNRFYDYALRCLYERSERRLARKEIMRDKRLEIRSDVKNNLAKMNDLENEKKMLQLGNIRCEHHKCKLYTHPNILLKDIQLKLKEKMQSIDGFNAEDLDEAEKLVMHCKCEVEWEKYEDVLKCVELHCRSCGHEILENVDLTPKYIMYLQKKRRSHSFVE